MHLGMRRICSTTALSVGSHPSSFNEHSVHWTWSGQLLVGTNSNPAAARSLGCGVGGV